jgi:hypothetical protein
MHHRADKGIVNSKSGNDLGSFLVPAMKSEVVSFVWRRQRLGRATMGWKSTKFLKALRPAPSDSNEKVQHSRQVS